MALLFLSLKDHKNAQNLNIYFFLEQNKIFIILLNFY